LGIGVSFVCKLSWLNKIASIGCVGSASFDDSEVSSILGSESVGNLTDDEVIGVLGSDAYLLLEGTGDECVELADLGVGSNDSHSEGGDDSLGGSCGGLEIGE
jgi:hypothetical protein